MRGKSTRHNGGRRSNGSGTRSSSSRGGSRGRSSSMQRTSPLQQDGTGILNQEQVTELIYQALETELGGVEVYATALECVQNEDLKEEFEKYHEQTQRHVELMREVCQTLALDTDEETPGRLVVRRKAEALVESMKEALKVGNREAAEIVAVEAVVDAETKDHANWQLIGEIVKKGEGETAKALKKAYNEVEDQEDEHLYHSKGWARELWIQALGMKPVLPPPEEKKDVHSAIAASRAKQQRERMM
jgi:rubrerythrin